MESGFLLRSVCGLSIYVLEESVPIIAVRSLYDLCDYRRSVAALCDVRQHHRWRQWRCQRTVLAPFWPLPQPSIVAVAVAASDCCCRCCCSCCCVPRFAPAAPAELGPAPEPVRSFAPAGRDRRCWVNAPDAPAPWRANRQLNCFWKRKRERDNYIAQLLL